MAIGTHLSGQPWRNSPLVGIYERVVSIADVGGERNYRSSSAEPKGDNNRFRAVWWETVVRETTRVNPWTGVGFGYDLADDFLKAYYPDSDEQFTARSPHNFFITVYARMGVIGVGLFVIACALLVVRARTAFREKVSPEKILPWCVALSLLTSACFGVVLEGPMGAVVFWISLGLGAGSAAVQPLEASPATASEA
jgi:O-antigen ligase